MIGKHYKHSNIGNRKVNSRKERVFQLQYMDFNEFGGIVQYGMKIKANCFADAKGLLLRKYNSAWDITEKD